MITVETEYVRALGRLPVLFPDTELLQQIESAARHVEKLLAGATPTKKNDVERAREAIACFAIAYALPIVNTFFLSDAKNVARQVAETDYVFNDAHEIIKLVQMWKNRAAEALRDISRNSGAVNMIVI